MSKTKINHTDYRKWDHIVREEVSKIEEEEKDITKDFMPWMKIIYEQQDENGKRAMKKSISLSNGKVLSTNWDEVKDKTAEDFKKDIEKDEKD